MLRRVFRAVILLACLVALGLGAWVLFVPPPSPPRPWPREAPSAAALPRSAPAVAAAAARSGLATPFGDALFRWRCTEGLREALGGNPAWPLRRVARFCRCAADRLRAEGPRDLVLGDGDVASALEAAEARFCRTP